MKELVSFVVIVPDHVNNARATGIHPRQLPEAEGSRRDAIPLDPYACGAASRLDLLNVMCAVVAPSL